MSVVLGLMILSNIRWQTDVRVDHGNAQWREVSYVSGQHRVAALDGRRRNCRIRQAGIVPLFAGMIREHADAPCDRQIDRQYAVGVEMQQSVQPVAETFHLCVRAGAAAAGPPVPAPTP